MTPWLAAWTSNKKLDNEFLAEFNKSLQLGVNNIDAVVEQFGKTGIITGQVLKKYLTENIDFNLDEKKREGLKLFLDLLAKL